MILFGGKLEPLETEIQIPAHPWWWGTAVQVKGRYCQKLCLEPPTMRSELNIKINVIILRVNVKYESEKPEEKNLVPTI